MSNLPIFEDYINRLELYHGSPYLFTKFDLSKVGTSDGNSKYGYGIYLTDNRNVAAMYAADNTLRNNKDGMNVYTVLVYRAEFMDWDKLVPEDMYLEVADWLDDNGYEDDAETMRDELESYGDTWLFSSMYEILSHTLGSEKKTSKLLNEEFGLAGWYSKEFMFGGTLYCIIDTQHVKILDVSKV